jgi:hypothetical protein
MDMDGRDPHEQRRAPGSRARAMDLIDRATDPFAWTADLFAQVPGPVAKVPPSRAPSRPPFERAPTNVARGAPSRAPSRPPFERAPANVARGALPSVRVWPNERRDRVNEREVAPTEARAPVPFAHFHPSVGRSIPRAARAGTDAAYLPLAGEGVRLGPPNHRAGGCRPHGGFGGPAGTRTRDLRIKSPQLYRLSYRPMGCASLAPRAF